MEVSFRREPCPTPRRWKAHALLGAVSLEGLVRAPAGGVCARSSKSGRVHSGAWLPAPFRHRGAARTRIAAPGAGTEAARSQLAGRRSLTFFRRRSLASRVRVARDGTRSSSRGSATSQARRNHWRAGRDSNPRPSGSKPESAPRNDAGLRLVALHRPAQSGTAPETATAPPRHPSGRCHTRQAHSSHRVVGPSATPTW